MHSKIQYQKRTKHELSKTNLEKKISIRLRRKALREFNKKTTNFNLLESMQLGATKNKRKKHQNITKKKRKIIKKNKKRIIEKQRQQSQFCYKLKILLEYDNDKCQTIIVKQHD